MYILVGEELSEIEGVRVEKERKFKLRAFHDKLASIKVLESTLQRLIQSNDSPKLAA